MSLQQLDDELAHQIRIAKSHSAQYCEWPYASFRHQVASGSTPGPKKSKKRISTETHHNIPPM